MALQSQTLNIEDGHNQVFDSRNGKVAAKYDNAGVLEQIRIMYPTNPTPNKHLGNHEPKRGKLREKMRTRSQDIVY